MLTKIHILVIQTIIPGYLTYKLLEYTFLKKTEKNSTIKLWAGIINSHLVTNLFEISQDEDNYDNLLD